MVGYEFESISQGLCVLSGARVGYIPFSGSVYYKSQHLGDRYESQIKMSNKTLLTKGDQHTYGAEVIVSHCIVNKHMESVFSYIL